MRFRAHFLVVALAAALVATLASNASALANPGFESGSFAGWSTFSSGWRVSNFGGDQHSGTFGAVNDVFPADGDVFRGVHQEISVTAGNTYTGGAWIRTVALDGDSQSWFEVQFRDASNNLLQQFESPHVTADQPFTFMTPGP